MGLQWMILTYVVAAEAAIAALLTLPSPKLLKGGLVSLISLLLQPALFIVPFAGFLLLDIYWKNEHRLMCAGENCTASERDRYEKSVMKCGDDFSLFIECLKLCWILVVTSVIASKIYKAQGNAILCVSACLLYWCVYRICKFYKEIQSLEAVEKRFKNQ
ncbi:BCR-ASSOCIATED PROTEIN BAP [Salix koriyanagi]|uniref:Endoplasmic reticulum transmembrane protein n=2 Tax=Salix TaxID=40685 RepID=A0A9Q0SS43_9ROSI|nr:BCR-ASSOCIATED PROTEIN BAP [Salix koriyanagi]